MNTLLNAVTQGDCLDLLNEVPTASVDMVLCDLPYGTTQNKWDSVIPFAPLWEQYRRVMKSGGAVVLTAAQPFTAILVISNLQWFKYEWIWAKATTGFLNANRRPMACHESVVVFCEQRPPYSPQGLRVCGKKLGGRTSTANWGKFSPKAISSFTHYPVSIIGFGPDRPSIHPTQKPVALFEYLIRTYTNPGDTVLDNCCGSGTTGVACAHTGRNSIQFDLDAGYCDIARRRLADASGEQGLFDAA